MNNQVLNNMHERYSCRKFSDQKLTGEEINTILDAGRCAPSAKNVQPWKFLVITSDDGLAKVDEVSPCRYNAQCCILLCFDEDITFKNEVAPDYGWIDCGISIAHMALAAKSIGIDSCIVGMYSPDKARELFNIPSNIRTFQFLMLGHGVEGPSERHSSIKDADETVVYNQF